TPLSATQLNATAIVPGSFVYSPALGTVLNAGAAQTLSVTFTPTDTANYTAATKTVSIDVTKATPTITWPAPTAITYGTSLSATQLDATANVQGTFVYNPPLTTVLNAGAEQTLSVTFTPTDAANYTTQTATVTIDVAKATPTITWAAPAAITYGTALSATQLNAVTQPLVAGTFAYAAGEASAGGQILGAGAHAITAIFAPTDAANYSAAQWTVTIAVLQATPTISWATPAAIIYGTALTGTQLNAITQPLVAGTFTYVAGGTAAGGQILGAGSHTITATFTPADAA